jgi:hypothetical protein
MSYALLLAAWSVFGSGPHAEQHFTVGVTAGARVHVESANGYITVTTGRAGSGIAVTVTKRADTLEQVRALEVATDRNGNDVTLRAVYPKGCGSGSCGGEISFDLTVPRGTRLDLRTSNGYIKATGITADSRMASSNGSVSASYSVFTAVKQVSLSTSNGAVSLALPAAAKIGRLRMETSVGRLNSDWPVEIDRSNFVGGSVDRTFNAGAASITLQTSNGSVTLRKI